jgi:secretion/DNA translocation related TadE-like protein
VTSPRPSRRHPAHWQRDHGDAHLPQGRNSPHPSAAARGLPPSTSARACLRSGVIGGRPSAATRARLSRPRPLAGATGRARPPEERGEGESGSVTVLALGFVVVLMAVTLVAVDVGMLALTRARVQSAADLAALAAVTPSSGPPGQAAEMIARDNGARLASCDCRPEASVVAVDQRVRLLPVGPTVRMEARARAVLPVTALYPNGLPALPGDTDQAPGGPAAGSARALLRNARLELTPNARADLAAGVLDARLVRLLTAMLREHRLAISVVRTGHTRFVAGTRTISKHTLGRAVDIWKVDGGLVRPGHPPSLEVTTWLAGLRGSSRPSEVGSPFPRFEAAPGHFSNAAHLDHLHVAVG